MKEKKLYDKQFREETQRRLEKIKQESLAVPVEAEHVKAASSVTKTEAKFNLLSYLTFGLWSTSDSK